MTAPRANDSEQRRVVLDAPHGTHLGYFSRGCRCAPCTIAAREYNRELRAKRKGGGR